jgi:hypothetical protein
VVAGFNRAQLRLQPRQFPRHTLLQPLEHELVLALNGFLATDRACHLSIVEHPPGVAHTGANF